MKYIYLLVLCILLANCSGGGNPNDPEQPAPLDLTGSEGVVLSELTVPDEVFEKERFGVTYTVENRGLSDIWGDRFGTLTVSLDSLYLEFLTLDSPFVSQAYGDLTDPTQFPFILRGRTPYIPGEQAFVTLQLRARPLQRFSERVQTSVFTTACYPYQSNTTQDVCIETDYYQDQGAIACRNNVLRPLTPGGPVAVTQVDVRNLRTIDDSNPELVGKIQPTFRLLIENLGEGFPSLDPCLKGQDTPPEPPAGFRGLSAVYVRASLLNVPLRCTGENPGDAAIVRLSQGRGSVLCSLPDELSEDDELSFSLGTGNFMSLLSVDLEYYYRETFTTEISIQHE